MRIRRPLLAAPLALGAVVAGVLAASELVHRVASTRGLGRSPGRPDGSVGREAVVVLGFGDTGPRANRINRYRVDEALRSMDPRAASTALVLCGGSVMGDEPEARILARYARERGYSGPVVLEETSRSTRENVAHAIPLIEDADTIRIVSDSVHAEEARGYLRAARPDLADRLAHAEEYRVGEVTWMKPLAIVVAGLRRLRAHPHDGGHVPKAHARHRQAGYLRGVSSFRPLLVMDYEFSYLGGAQTAVVQQALALARAGHRVTVAAPDATSAQVLRDAGVALHDIAPTYRVRLMGLPLIRADAATRADLALLMEESGTDLVLTHSEHGLAAAALGVARERGIPSMHTVHTFFMRGPAWAGFLTPAVNGVHRYMTGLPAPRVRLAPRRLDSALRGLTLATCREADLVLSPSRHQAVALRDAGLPAVEVLSNTSSATRAEPAPLPAGDALRLVWAARFAPEKRLRVMLDAMALVAERAGPGAVHLDLAGGDLQAPAPAGVTLHGRVLTTEVTALLRGAHAAVVTSLGFDNQPMIAMEAFAEGRPVIVSDPVLAAEFGDAALLAADADAAGLAEAILRLARDRRLLDAPVDAAARLAASVAPAAHARALEDAFLRIASPRRGSASA